MEVVAPTSSQIGWLLDGDDPSIRFFTLTELLGQPADAPDVVATRRAIMTEGPVPALLAEQLPDGHWVGRDQFYTAKYRGTVWDLIILAELGADGADERVRRGCEAVLRDAQDILSGGFAHKRSKKAGGGLHSEVIPCLTGNMAFSLIRLGMLDDPRVERALDWITTYQRFDDAEGDAPGGWPYERYVMCWGRHTCHMGAVKALKALAEVPAERRTTAMQATIDAGVDYLLRHHIHKRSHDLGKTAKPSWRQLGFPRMWQTDVLEILGLLGKLGRSGDERAREARELVASRADADGRWRLQQTFNGRFVVDIETKGEPSRWVTLKALQALAA